MTDKQEKIYKTQCEIEYSQEYLRRRDITIIFEDLFIWSKDVNGKPEKYAVRERIVGFYHGEPNEEDFENYYSKGCEGVMDDEMMTVLTKTHGETPEPKYDYNVVVYGGFDEVPLIRYQRTYETEEEAQDTYLELKDTFKLEHRIYDNAKEEVINQEDCSMLALIKSGPYDDDKCIVFDSLLDKSNMYYRHDYNEIMEFFINEDYIDG